MESKKLTLPELLDSKGFCEARLNKKHHIYRIQEGGHSILYWSRSKMVLIPTEVKAYNKSRKLIFHRFCDCEIWVPKSDIAVNLKNVFTHPRMIHTRGIELLGSLRAYESLREECFLTRYFSRDFAWYDIHILEDYQ